MPLLAVVDRPGLKPRTPPSKEKTDPVPKKQESDYHNSILLKMTPKLSKLELIILSIVDGICKGNKKNKTCSLTVKELSDQVACRMPSRRINQGSVKRARRSLQRRRLLVLVKTWGKKKVFTTAIPRAEAEGFKGLQIPLEAATDPNLSNAAKLIFGRLHYLLTVNDEKRIYINWTDEKLADDLNIGLRQTKAAIAVLKSRGYLFAGGKTRRRKLSLDPEWTNRNKIVLPDFTRRTTKKKGYKRVPSSLPLGYKRVPNGFAEQLDFVSKKADFQAPTNITNNKYFSFQEKWHRKAAQKEQEMSICQSRAMDRIVAHWKSKKPSLKVSGQRVTGRALPVLKALLSKHGEKTILETINLYHESLHNPTLICSKFNKRPAYRVSIEEFFAGFSIDNQIFIKQNKIKCLEGVDGWFQMCLKGAEEIERRFALVVADRFPVVTKLLREVISSWDGHPSLVGNRAESNLRKSAARLVEFHQRVKSRLATGRTEMRLSTPAFLCEYFVPYVLENLNLDRFRIYWLMSERFMDDFEQHLVDMRALAPPKERRVGGRRIARRLNPDEEDLRGVGSRGNWIGGRVEAEADRVEPETPPEDYLDAADY